MGLPMRTQMTRMLTPSMRSQGCPHPAWASSVRRRPEIRPLCAGAETTGECAPKARAPKAHSPTASAPKLGSDDKLWCVLRDAPWQVIAQGAAGVEQVVELTKTKTQAKRYKMGRGGLVFAWGYARTTDILPHMLRDPQPLVLSCLAESKNALYGVSCVKVYAFDAGSSVQSLLNYAKKREGRVGERFAQAVVFHRINADPGLALLLRVTWVEDPVAAEEELLSSVSFPLTIKNQAPGARPDWAAIRSTPLMLPGDDVLLEMEREFNENKKRLRDADAGGGGYFGC